MDKHNKLFIKGMVCNRCISLLNKELSRLGLQVQSITLGEVTLAENQPAINDTLLKTMLQENGFDLLRDKNELLTLQIKQLVEEGIKTQAETGTPVKFSKLISQGLNKSYDSLSAFFSYSAGVTLEKYIILRRIDKVKELLVYTDKTLTDIAYELGYSSIAHLSRQLKEVSGFNATHYKKIRKEKLAAAANNGDIAL